MKFHAKLHHRAYRGIEVEPLLYILRDLLYRLMRRPVELIKPRKAV